MVLFSQKYPGWSVKGLRFFRGMEGDGFNGTLYKDGKKVVFVINEGNGGMLNYEDFDKEWERKLDELVEATRKTIPDKEDGEGFNDHKLFDRDWMVEDMMVKWEFEAKIQRLIKKKLVFTVPGDEEGSVRDLSAPYDEKSKAYILKKYPNAVILNEVLR